MFCLQAKNKRYSEIVRGLAKKSVLTKGEGGVSWFPTLLFQGEGAMLNFRIFADLIVNSPLLVEM